jgi:hypothetical protein
MFRVGVAAALLGIFLTVVPASAADSRDVLAKARAFYNQGQFDAALTAADEARRNPERADGADLIAARAYLERYRTTAVGDDLVSARERLGRINPSRFTAGERLEFVVGLGETLYFDDASGAAAVIFESVLAGPSELPARARERVLDWWASALDHDARSRPDIERQGVYQRIRDRMAKELAANPGNVAAAYWAAAAARGQGDLQAAWDAVQAAWVKASMAGDREAALRDDLDRLVARALVPERARMLAQPPEQLTAEWEQFKEKWVR